MKAAYPSTSALVFHSQSEDQQPTADMGWALKKTKKSVHFTTKRAPIQGEDTGNKPKAEDVAARMRFMRTAGGNEGVHQRRVADIDTDFQIFQ